MGTKPRKPVAPSEEKLSLDQIRAIARAPLPPIRNHIGGHAWSGHTTTIHTPESPIKYPETRPGQRFFQPLADRETCPDHNSILDADIEEFLAYMEDDDADRLTE